MTEHDFIPFSPPLIEEDDIQEVADCLRSGWITTGPRVEAFQKLVADKAGCAHAVATSSCTMAMHVALMVMGIGPGQEVLTTPLTFASTAHAVLYVGAEPVFADVEPDTGNLDPRAVRRLIERQYRLKDGALVNVATGRRLTALLPVHYGGHCCDMDPLMEIAEEFGLLVLEDAAHALGAEYKGRPAGSLGHAACFSFYATKNVVTAEGGMLVTNNEEWAEAARRTTMYGISDARKIWGRYKPKGTWIYDVAELGLKCNMPDVLAALGLTQMRKLDTIEGRRQEYAALYDQAFASRPELIVPPLRAYAGHCRHLYPLRLNVDNLPEARDRAIELLRDRGVGTSVLFIPLHFHSFYRERLGGATEGLFPASEAFFKSVVNLPISPALGAEKIRRVADAVLDMLGDL